MRNYMMADLIRIFKRVPRTVLMLICFVLICVSIPGSVSAANMLSDAALGADAAADLVISSIGSTVAFSSGILGLFELIFVFSDDMKAKTTQIAIGVGVSRSKVVLSKFCELLVLLAVDALILVLLILTVGSIAGASFGGASILKLVATIAGEVLLKNAAYASLVFILLFTIRSVTLGVIAFLALSFQVVSGGLFFLTNSIKALESLNLGSYTLSGMLGKVNEILCGAAFDPLPVIGCLAYVGLSLFLTIFLFKKKELEF